MNNINEIESLTWDQAQKLAMEIVKIKGHDVILADLGEYFGYSALVFKNGEHIYFANEYQLHYRWVEASKLKDKYIQKLNEKLFEEAELFEPIRNYEEYLAKDHWLRNYWCQQFPYASIFRLDTDDEIDTEKFPYLCINCFCYVQEKWIVERASVLGTALEARHKEFSASLEGFREEVRSELRNHEACITCSYCEALEALGLEFEKLSPERQQIVKEELARQVNQYEMV